MCGGHSPVVSRAQIYIQFIIFVISQKRAKAQCLLDKVFEYLELVEKDYFGLQYADVAPAPDGMVSHIYIPNKHRACT